MPVAEDVVRAIYIVHRDVLLKTAINILESFQDLGELRDN